MRRKTTSKITSPSPSFAAYLPLADIQLVRETGVSADYFNCLNCVVMALGKFSDPDYLPIIVRKLKSFETYKSYLKRHCKFNPQYTRKTQNQKDLLSLSSEFASILEKGSVEITAVKKYATAMALAIYGEHNCCYLDTVSILKNVSDEGVISLS